MNCDGIQFSPGATANCTAGTLVIISGENYPHFAKFTVQSDLGMYDQSTQQSDSTGHVELPEDLSPAGTYTVTYSKGQTLRIVTIIVSDPA